MDVWHKYSAGVFEGIMYTVHQHLLTTGAAIGIYYLLYTIVQRVSSWSSTFDLFYSLRKVYLFHMYCTFVNASIVTHWCVIIDVPLLPSELVSLIVLLPFHLLCVAAFVFLWLRPDSNSLYGPKLCFFSGHFLRLLSFTFIYEQIEKIVKMN